MFVNDDDGAAARASLVDDIVQQLNQLKKMIAELEHATRVHEDRQAALTKQRLQ
jgi:hypothetical protein